MVLERVLLKMPCFPANMFSKIGEGEVAVFSAK